MHKLAALLLLPLSLLAFPACSATVPGAIASSFGVSETGAATYRIPIAIPPGTAGMEPKLSLNYSSQGGNGIAGVGWSLGGLSSITRCPQTIVQDGQTRGIQFDANDRLCLDGQRLILTAGASYGAIGAEYRTELESFSKVVSIGGTAGDPQSFLVKTKAGQIIEFGNTTDSRIEAQGKTIAASWAVNKISDTIGNYIAFTYFEDNANGEYRVTRIDYTGNAAASVSPNNAVEFQYEARPDPSSGYLAGSLNQQTQRLSHILTRAGEALVMDFGLNYEIGTTTGRSRLINLTQCAMGGDCLAPTAFSWQEGEAAAFEPVAVETIAPTGTVNDTWFALGDLNTDGRTDALFFNSARSFKSYLAEDAGTFLQGPVVATSGPWSWSSTPSPQKLRMFLTDVNGDGRPDAVTCGSDYIPTGWSFANTWFAAVWLNDAGTIGGTTGSYTQNFFRYDYAYDTSPNLQWCLTGDANADGRADVIPYLSNYWKQIGRLDSLGDGTLTPAASVIWTAGASIPTKTYMSAFQVVDVNGDNSADSVWYDHASGQLKVWLANTTAFAAPVSTTIDAGGSPSDRWFTVADVNGDGLADMVLHTPTDGTLKVWLSKGDGTVTAKFETTGFSTGGTPYDAWFLMVDVNADGRADAVKYLPGTGDVTIALSLDGGSFGTAIVGANVGAGPNPTLGIGPYPTTGWFSPADVNGDGLPDWVRYDPPTGKIKVNLGSGHVPDQLLTITDGLGAIRDITYKSLTDASVYTKGTGSVYPVQDVQAAMYVVSETAADDGIGGQFRMTYRYEGARAHLTGRGFLGFATLEQTDQQTGIVTRTDYRQDFPYIGQPTLITRTSSGGVELNRVENTHEVKVISGGGQFPYLAYSKEQSNDLNAAVLPVIEIWNTYGDDWGNLTQVITQTTDGFRKQTDNTYTNDATNWFLGRLTRASVTSTVSSWTQTRVSAFEYDATTGLLNKEILEPDQPQLRLETTYAHDDFGNRKTVTVSSPATGTAAIATRSTTTSYDLKGQFPETVTNVLGHSESKTFDARFGTVASLTGPNALTTAWQYDSFGRKTRETRADNTFTQWTYDVCDAACPAYGVYRVVTQTFASGGIQSAPASVAYFDRLNREVRNAVQAFDGRWVYKDTEYDGPGRVARASRPYFAGGAVYWTTSVYDDLGRVTQAFEPDEPATAALTVDYNGLTVIRTNRKAQSRTEVKNSQGQTVSVTDALAKTTTYAYDPFGNPLYILNPDGLNVSLTLYDIRGRKTYGYTPDMGGWSYEYDALSELVKQTDAKQQITSFAYDKLGRMTSRAEPGLTSTWTYDGAFYGKGKLQSATTSLGYNRTHYYDDKGRPFFTLFNLGAGEPMLFTTTVYDTAGRIAEQYYPSGLGLKQVFNALGHVAELRNTGTDTLYWKLDAQDAEGHLTQETYGNGVVTQRGYIASNGRLQNIVGTAAGGGQVQGAGYFYDTLGNIWLRGDDTGADFPTYDDLNRLTGLTRYDPSGTTVETVVYDAKGNITSKSGVGDYSYGGSPNCAAGNGAGPHAVCKAGTNAYTYDANGNLTSGGRSVSWTAWNMPASITENGSTTSWNYGPEHDRYKMTTAGRTTWYLSPGVHQGGHYERTKYASGTVEHRHTLYGAGRPIGEVLILDSGGTTSEQTRYFHSDHQGSITVVTDSAGAVLTRYRYDPWGKQTLVSGSNTGISQTRQGHTGHEMLDGGLTHMNGRVYDPTLARFVSADPVVQDPYNLQSVNRYSYVMNNPLYYTDPTGFSAWTDFRDGFFKPVVAIAAAWVIGPMVFNAVLPSAVGAAGATGMGMSGSVWAGTAIAGAASGAAVGGITGGIYNGPQGIAQGAKYGAIGGAIMGPVSAMYSGAYNGSLNGAARYGYSAERVAVQSLAGGVSSMAQGRSFIDGLKSSFIPSALTYMAVSMRASMVDSSRLYVDPVTGETKNLSGSSSGFMGDGYKVGGARLVFDEALGAFKTCDSPLGGCQGSAGRIFGMQYGAGSWQDRLVEAYAGPHDALNSSYWYNSLGNGINHQGLASALGEVLNGLNVIPASAFAGASVVQPYNYSSVFGR